MRVSSLKNQTALKGILGLFGLGKDLGNVVTSNVTTRFREAFGTYTPGEVWVENKAAGDLIYLDGNTVGSSYLVISKDPTTIGTETSITSVQSFGMPMEAAFGVSMSQRTVGQEFSTEIIDVGPDVIATISEIPIATMSQATTTLTVTTAAAHGLKVGQRIGIYGCVDPRLNYGSVVVASILSLTQFTITGGPQGSIPSLTVGPFTSGTIYPRPALGYAKSGTSMIFEAGAATTASYYDRADSNDALPSGTVSSSHGVTCGSTASAMPVSAPYSYSFQPTTEFKAAIQADRLQWGDVAVDSMSGTISRFTKSQVIPNNTKLYKARFRAANRKGFTVPTAKIVSITKTGTTTATVTTDVAHGLTTADLVTIYGVRDQTNFANLTTATAVASVVNSTTFTIVLGSAVTATSYGGLVARVQGGVLPSILGYQASAIQRVTLTAGVLTLVGSATFVGGVVVGDSINIHGCRNAVNGGDVGIDGAWKIRKLATTTLELEPLGWTPPADFVLTNCGGEVIRRTDMRISFVRIFDYKRERVEIQARSVSDEASAVPVAVKGGLVTAAQSTAASLKADAAQGLRGSVTQGSGWFMQPDNAIVGDVVSAALTTTTTTTAITPTPLGGAASFNIAVTLVSGTNPTLDVGIEESDDTGTNWYRIYDFPRITIAGSYRSPVLPLTGNRLRYVQTVSGTSPSFTRSINRQVHLGVSPPPFRQMFDHSLAINSAVAGAGILRMNGAKNLMLSGQLTVFGTVAPVIVLQGRDSEGVWVEIAGSSITLAAAATGYYVVVTNIVFDQVRFSVKSAGTGCTLNFLCAKAFG